MRVALGLLLLLVVGCAAGPEARDEEPFHPEVAPITSSTEAPDEVAARALMVEGRYAAAFEAFRTLATFEPDPGRRAEFIFFSAEAALGAGAHEDAYEQYRKLLRRYPATPRYPLVLERLFLLGRLYAEGRAEATTWFFGMPMSDRSLGIEILEEFQRARPQHPLADDALHEIGLARLAQDEHGLAIDAWQKLMDEYPESDWYETAEFRIGTTFAAMSDGVEYDKQPLRTGLLRLRRYVDRHPTGGNHLAEANAEIARLEEELAAFQVDVARFYLRPHRDRPYAALIYLEDVLREYPRTEAAKEAARLKADLGVVAAPPPPETDEDDEVPEDVAPQPEPAPSAYPVTPVD
jgi:outer membrane protein assembly factor BamD